MPDCCCVHEWAAFSHLLSHKFGRKISDITFCAVPVVASLASNYKVSEPNWRENIRWWSNPKQLFGASAVAEVEVSFEERRKNRSPLLLLSIIYCQSDPIRSNSIRSILCNQNLKETPIQKWCHNSHTRALSNEIRFLSKSCATHKRLGWNTSSMFVCLLPTNLRPASTFRALQIRV